MRQELSNVATNEELYSVIDVIRKQRDNVCYQSLLFCLFVCSHVHLFTRYILQPDEDYSLEAQRRSTPWFPRDCDISITPKDGYELWKPEEVVPCSLSAKSRRYFHKKFDTNATNGKGYLWFMLVGVGKNTLSQHGFRSLRDSFEAEEWLCRPRVCYFCVIETEESRRMLEARRLELFYHPCDPEVAE